MKHLFFLAAFLLAACSPALQAQDLKSEMTALAKAWQEASNRGDASALQTMYADEVVIVNAKDNSKTVLTKAQLLEGDIQQFSEMDDQTTIVLETTEALPDGKVKVTGTVSGVRTTKKSGEKTNYVFRFENLIIQENGQWKACQFKNWVP
ncbi:MAG: nuclear transport factor 2 family protein [Saprospiraceae bacterium]|nr:nuclear transport factor 2 family protein [Saprospiraceae bacterium]